MKLNQIELHDFFNEKGITHLYHANTVTTSIAFLTSNGLLSRGLASSMNLPQTIQTSDAADVLHNVWNDIFLDTADLHGYFPRQNLYGPVLFRFNIDFLLNTENDYNIWITKNNPCHWHTDITDSDKYFTNVSELQEKWGNYDQHQMMVTLRNLQTPILFNYLEDITLDDHAITITIGETQESLYDYSHNLLNSAKMQNHNLNNIPINKRSCSHSCYCRVNYSGMTDNVLIKLFSAPSESFFDRSLLVPNNLQSIEN